MKRIIVNWLFVVGFALAVSVVGNSQQQASSSARLLTTRHRCHVDQRATADERKADALEQTLAKDPNDLTADSPNQLLLGPLREPDEGKEV
jgi:hypothetical protein